MLLGQLGSEPFRVEEQRAVERGEARKHKLPVKLRYQVCNEALCWPPENIVLETELEVLASQR